MAPKAVKNKNWFVCYSPNTHVFSLLCYGPETAIILDDQKLDFGINAEHEYNSLYLNIQNIILS